MLGYPHHKIQKISKSTLNQKCKNYRTFFRLYNLGKMGLVPNSEIKKISKAILSLNPKQRFSNRENIELVFELKPSLDVFENTLGNATLLLFIFCHATINYYYTRNKSEI